jgi:hypothetical protein
MEPRGDERSVVVLGDNYKHIYIYNGEREKLIDENEYRCKSTIKLEAES